MNKNKRIITNVSEKWMLIYHALPEDGSPLRFIQIKGIFKELCKDDTKKISPVTIKAALDYFCFCGMVKRETKGKTILYLRNNINIPITLAELRLPTDKLSHPHLTQEELMLVLMEEYASTLDIILNKTNHCLCDALTNYIKEQDKEKALGRFNITIQTLLVPMFRMLPRFADTFNLDSNTLLQWEDCLRNAWHGLDKSHLDSTTLQRYEKYLNIKPKGLQKES